MMARIAQINEFKVFKYKEDNMKEFLSVFKFIRFLENQNGN
jgi:hypothetical protein